MVVEPTVPAGRPAAPAGGGTKDAKQAEGAIGRIVARKRIPLGDDGKRPQCHPDGRDAARCVRRRAVGNETRARIDFMKEVLKGAALLALQEGLSAHVRSSLA
jgi:hypothetical protein